MSTVFIFCYWFQEREVISKDLIKLRRKNTDLDSERQERDKILNHLRTRVAVLEQELKDKENVCSDCFSKYWFSKILVWKSLKLRIFCFKLLQWCRIDWNCCLLAVLPLDKSKSNSFTSMRIYVGSVSCAPFFAYFFLVFLPL